MGADAEEPESKAGKQKSPKTKAEDNPWYLLATLYGVPPVLYQDDELRDENRLYWNRYFAANLPEELRVRFIEEKRHHPDELRTLSKNELQKVEQAFVKRKGSANFVLPKNTDRIDFSNVQFGGDISFDEYLFSECSFREATFCSRATFAGATFFTIWKTTFLAQPSVEQLSATQFDLTMFISLIGPTSRARLSMAELSLTAWPSPTGLYS
jgi:hypothetical protein